MTYIWSKDTPSLHWYKGHVRKPKVRDSKRSAAYAAEKQAFPDMKSGPHPDLRTVAQCERFIGNITKSAWFIRRWGLRDIHVRDGRGTRIARGGGNSVNLPLWARTAEVILHEMAHCLARTRPGHGPEWAAIYLDLVRFHLGGDEADRLATEFKKRNVRFRPYRKPSSKKKTLPPQLRAHLEERRLLAAAKSKPSPVNMAKLHLAKLRTANGTMTFKGVDIRELDKGDLVRLCCHLFNR